MAAILTVFRVSRFLREHDAHGKLGAYGSIIIQDEYRVTYGFNPLGLDALRPVAIASPG